MAQGMQRPIRNESLAAMFDELTRAQPIYRPSAFWDWYIDKNLEQIERQGLERFKRTINQNYYNWLPANFQDNQLKNLIQYWAANPSLHPLRARLEGDFTVETVVESHPFADPERRELYTLFVGLLWHHASQNDRYGILKNVGEPEVGDPLRVMLDGKLISQDVANSAREFTAVRDHLPDAADRPPCVAELGAGYGRLAYVFSSALACRYWIFDIPPALYVSQWYLSRVFPGKKIFRFRHFDHFDEVRAEVASSDLCFFTANQLELIPDGAVDAFLSVSSLQEMTRAQIDNYLGLIQRKTRELVYFKQWIRSQNPIDGLVLEKDAYMLRGQWSAALERTDAIQDLFFEIVFRKGVQSPAAGSPPRSDSAETPPAQAARLARRVKRWLTARLRKAS